MDNSAEVLFEKGGRVWLRVLVKPQSRKAGLLGLHAGSLKIAVKAPPLEGRANQDLIEVLADLLGCARSQLTVEQGASSRNKLVSVSGLDRNRILRILEKLLSDA